MYAVSCNLPNSSLKYYIIPFTDEKKEGKGIGWRHSVNYLVTLKTKFSLNTSYINARYSGQSSFSEIQKPSNWLCKVIFLFFVIYLFVRDAKM